MASERVRGEWIGSEPVILVSRIRLLLALVALLVPVLEYSEGRVLMSR
jgi:hypothetical protein